MKNVVNSRRLDIQAQSALHGLFRGKMVEASKLNGNVVMKAQLGIKRLETEINLFIESKSYSLFTIYEEDDSISITVKNFKSLPDNTTAHKYEIVIEPTWQNATIYQASLGNVMTRQRRVFDND